MDDKLKVAIDSAQSAIAFSPHDWGADKRLAWVYGILVGWDDEALAEMQKKFRWTDESVERLKSYHEAIKATQGE